MFASKSIVTRRRLMSISIYVAITFIVLTLIAMLVYPGGTNSDHNAPHYDFFRNFFSDLGRTTTFLGEPQWLSCLLFNGALTLGGLAFFGFFKELTGAFENIPRARNLARAGAVFGFAAGICYIGIAFTPWDVLPNGHMIFVKTGMPVFLIASILFAIAISRHPSYPKVYVWVFLAFIPILLGYVYLLFWGPSSKTESGLIIQATWQKALVYSELVVLIVQGRGALRMMKEE